MLAITWNGLLAGFLHRRLGGRSRQRAGRLLVAVSAVSAAISQAGWWGAMAIGFLNH